MADITSEYFKTPQIGKSVPDRVLLFRWGYNSTEKGPLYLTKESANEIIAEFNRRQNPLVFNLEHKKPGPVYAYGTQIETDNIGLWVKTNWTSEGKELVESGKWGFLSPEIWTNEFGRIKKLNAIAITNMPAINAAPPILLSTEDKMNNQLTSKVKPLKDMKIGLGMCLNAMEKIMSIQGDYPAKKFAQDISGTVPEWITAIAELIEQLDPLGETLPEQQSELPILENLPQRTNMTDQKSLSTDTVDITASVATTTTTSAEPVIAAPKITMDSQTDWTVFLSEMTGETETDKIKAKLLAQKHNLFDTEGALQDTQKKLKEQMIAGAIGNATISAVEKETLLSLSLQGIESYIATRAEKKEKFIELSQKQQTITTDPYTQREQQVVDEIFSKMKKMK